MGTRSPINLRSGHRTVKVISAHPVLCPVLTGQHSTLRPLQSLCLGLSPFAPAPVLSGLKCRLSGTAMFILLQGNRPLTARAVFWELPQRYIISLGGQKWAAPPGQCHQAPGFESPTCHEVPVWLQERVIGFPRAGGWGGWEPRGLITAWWL